MNSFSLNQSSPQWKQLSLQLQIATAKPSLKILHLHKYPQKSNCSNSVDNNLIQESPTRAIIDATGLKSSFANLVVQKQIPLQDLMLICGHINLQHHHKRLDQIFHFLICQITPGLIAPLPSGFSHADSLLLQQNQAQMPYHYNLFLKQHSQYQILYDCSFVISDISQIINNAINCSLCGSTEAYLYCTNQSKHFCQNCSNQVHAPPSLQLQKKMKQVPRSHQLQRINRTNSLPLCQSHTLRHEFYCQKCEKYLCSNCILQPLHADNPQHIFRPIQYLYSEKRQINSKLPLNPRKNLIRLKDLLVRKQKQINANYQQVRKQLNLQVKKAQQELDNLYKSKIVAVESDLIKVDMELDKLQWQIDYLQQQQKILKPLHYFKLQNKLSSELSQVSTKEYGQSLEIRADIAQFSLFKVGSKEQVHDFKDFHTKDVGQRPNQRFSDRKATKQYKSQEKLLSFYPEEEFPQSGRLIFALEHLGSKIFKFKAH